MILAEPSPTVFVRVQLRAGQDLVVAGLHTSDATLRNTVKNLQWRWLFRDGDPVLKGQTLLDLKGPLDEFVRAQSALTRELGLMSGIATRTRQYAHRLADSSVRLRMPEAVTPGLEQIEQLAFQIGASETLSKERPALYLDVLQRMSRGGFAAIADKQQFTAECLTEEEIFAATIAGFNKITIPLDCLANLKLNTTAQVTVRGIFSDAQIPQLLQYPIQFLQPEILFAQTPPATLTWTLS